MGKQSPGTSLRVSISQPELNIKMKVAILLLSVVVLSQAESWVAAPFTLVKRAAQPEPQRGGSRPGTRFGFGRPSSSSSSSGQNTRFFTGNQAIDAGAAGAAAGVAAQFVANSLFNPCRTRGGTRTQNTATNNRIFGSNSGAGNFLLGAAAGFAGASLVNNAQGNPCG